MKKYAEGSIGTQIHVAGPVSYPVYVVDGENPLMVDAGINLLGPAYFRDMGKILGNPHRLRYLVMTHSHYDHIGAMPYLKRKIPGLELGGAERIEKLLRKQSVIDYMINLSDIQRDMFSEETGDEDVRIDSVTLDLKLTDGDTIDIGDYTCVVYEVPGHTRDSLAYYIPEENILFPGEAIGIPEGKDALDVQAEFLTSYSDYMNSIERMRQLQPGTIAMGHGWIFTGDDVKVFFDTSAEATIRHKKRLEEYLDNADGDAEKALHEMIRVEYDEKGTIYQERNAYIANLRAQFSLIAGMREYC
ncbi:MAG: MBL fold metallo-hydrolase [Spirochaetota bacterium]